MLSALKFVGRAVATKDFQPALTHFLIKDGRVLGYDGIIALSSPIDTDIHAAPKAVPFIKAIERCTSDTTAINLTETGRLTLRSGRFRAIIECIEDKEVLDYIKPEGEDVPTSDKLVEAMRVLIGYTSSDASRPWSNGILLRGYSAYATNNIILAQYWLGEAMPDVNLPTTAVTELIRIGTEPLRIQLGANSATFHFPGDRWLRTQLLDPKWPTIDFMLDSVFGDTENPPCLLPFPDNFFEALDTIGPFVEKEGRILFREGMITTSLLGEAGASYEINGLPDFGAYNVKMLNLLREHVKAIDLTRHPKAAPFVGHNLRGVFLGMH
jgi:hypothetical protein